MSYISQGAFTWNNGRKPGTGSPFTLWADDHPCSHPAVTSLNPAMGPLSHGRRVTKGAFSPCISTTWYSISPLGQDEEDASDRDHHSCMQLYPAVSIQ